MDLAELAQQLLGTLIDGGFAGSSTGRIAA
jgi:hypothetical protein